MKIYVKKCVALPQLWDGDRAVKVTEPYFYRPYLGISVGQEDQCGEGEQIPMESALLYLGTTIAFNKEDEAEHGKHIIDSMKENIEAIGGFTPKFHAEVGRNQDHRVASD
jgi:hypothetical protein